MGNKCVTLGIWVNFFFLNLLLERVCRQSCNWFLSNCFQMPGIDEKFNIMSRGSYSTLVFPLNAMILFIINQNDLMTKFKGWCSTRIVKKIDFFCGQIVSPTWRGYMYQWTTFSPKNIKDHLVKIEQLSWKHFWKWVKLQGDILHRFFWLVYGPLLQFSFKQLYKLGILCHCLTIA